MERKRPLDVWLKKNILFRNYIELLRLDNLKESIQLFNYKTADCVF